MSNNKLKPEIRFKNFKDAWEQRKLRNELSLLKDGTHGTHKNVNDGPYLLSAKNIKNGKVNITIDDRKISSKEYESIHKSFKLNTNDILLTTVGSIGEAAILENPVGLTFQRSVAYLRTKDINSQFLYRVITGPKFQKELLKRQVVSAQPGIYLRDLAKINFYASKDSAEQKFIAKLFTELDNTIALHQHELTLLKQRKKAFLQKMFPKKGERNPELRLLNLDEEWRLQSIGHCFEERNERSSKGELLSVTINAGVVKASSLDRKDSSSKNKSNYKVVKKGDIAYNSMRMWQGASGVSLYNGIVSPAYTILIPEEEIDSHFFSYYFKLYYMIQTFQSNSQGLTSDTWNLKYPLIKNIQLSIPSYEEQIKISNFFKQLDEDIALHEHRLEKLKQLKKAFLQKMFV